MRNLNSFSIFTGTCIGFANFLNLNYYLKTKIPSTCVGQCIFVVTGLLMRSLILYYFLSILIHVLKLLNHFLNHYLKTKIPRALFKS